ncbi:hypothetical protein SKAU_G00196410 [Synaphobranchus kaupii]|uniref:Gypsy retrotransposon integrase-like protein 1 n=1 Tax=Synaphobranchus kaupii TaxID=118154 RepID=A0A9Q1FEM0_SYNKA|nr:hypothetical protein SKAU_G00196410 [Synaphobranchus kaupii]
MAIHYNAFRPTFERLMEKVLAGVPTENVQVYLDDVLLHTPDFDTALKSLHLAISKIKKAGLKLHPEKCKLLCWEITFLGHQMSGAGVAAMEGKVAAVRDWPVLRQVARWIEQLQEYNFTIVHRRGGNHTNADGLSRRPCRPDCTHCSRAEAQEVEAAKAWGERCMALRLDESADWAKDQREDMELSKILRWLEGGRWWSPRAGRLEANHGQPGVGHFGVNKTLHRVRRSFYWVTCWRDVQAFCCQCDPCTARKGPTDQSRAPLQQYRVGAPVERVAIDVLGPFPRTPRGNRFVIVAMDYFSKWPEAYAVPDQEAAMVFEALIEGMFSRFGVPAELHSDQGRNFERCVDN